MREEKIREIEIDQRWHFLRSKKNKRWILQALERRTGRTMAWVVGSRNAATAGKLDHKLSPLKECVFDTDDGKGYRKVWPTERHVIGKKTQYAWNKITPIADTILEE